MNTCWYWLIGIVAFLIVEGATYQLICIWFAVGCLAGMLANLAGAGVTAQFTTFVVVSLVALLATRPFVNKLLKNRPHEKTNADRLEGCTGLVIETVENTKAKGQVKAKGSIWSARSSSGEIINEGDLVTVKGIEGVKLLVERQEK